MVKIHQSFIIEDDKQKRVEQYFSSNFPNKNFNKNKIFNFIIDKFVTEVIEDGEKIADNSDSEYLRNQVSILKKQVDISTYVGLEMLKLIKHDPQNYRSVKNQGTKENEIYNQILSIVNYDIEVSKKIKDDQIK